MRIHLALLRAVVAVAALAAAFPQTAAAASGCAVQSGAQPLWIDYADHFVPFARDVFGRPGITGAVSRQQTASELRARGAAVVYWDMYLNKRVGTPSAPADPATIDQKAVRLLAHARRVTGCATPVIALNELFGAHLASPWSDTNAVYRANVLAFVRLLAKRGAQPHLLISRSPATGGATRTWWREVGAVAGVVRELYVPAPRLHAAGPLAADRMFRASVRRAVDELVATGIPASRVGLPLGFQSGASGRAGLEPLAAWYEIVRLETRVVAELGADLGLGTVWSWGWGRWDPDPNQRTTACVYLAARNPSLCNAPPVTVVTAAAPAARKVNRPRAGLRLLWARGATHVFRIATTQSLEGRLAYVQRRAGARWVSLRKIFLQLGSRTVVRFTLPRGWSELRVLIPSRPDLVSEIQLIRTD